MRRSLRYLTGVLVAVTAVAVGAGAPVSAQDRDPLAGDLDAILANPGLAGADVALVVRGADGTELYRRGSDRRQQPASNAKLVTSAAALEVLGPDYRFSTTAGATGRITGTVLHGDLYLRGTGDPTMLAADYDALAARVAASGVRLVTGNLVADDTWFDGVRLGSSWAWDDEPFYYDAQVSALTAAPDADYDAGSVIVRVTPSTPGAPATVETVPPTDHVRIVSTAVTGAAGSGTDVSVDREHGTNTITVAGSVAAGASPVQEWMAVWDPTGYAASLFRAALRAHGVRVLGRTTRAATPPDARTLADRRSMPLSELLVPFLKLSNNLHAEILMKAMGRARSGQGSWTAGVAAVNSVLPGLGIDPARLFLVDGSGLSRMDHISPDQLTALLLAARAKPWFGVWYDALPVAGVPDRMVGGTLRNRMRGTPAAGNVHAKTGSLTGVSALSGYVTAADGRLLVFSMVTNNSVGVSLRPIEDAVAVRLASPAGSAVTARSAPDGPEGLECSWLKAC
ncbi:MAG TPA: D-alanyl-D-alanine carboxypeptidase/D-alanyl-D-alanine-endopeptidase [Actinophytocola sp.]|uniref:D-alanyl-D-alanine carboxypeptidase/D-alanyl-D-alanine endopeptidase n=1 Tax=Actinophytocola sp. TaxID=1872138 RepID=UPI002DBCAC97|nr:D-alanyl-D-alanine carboxypeptidase/D-alanyl-D-alanine-endopeptidase [Actinophytocola sp.]HEU5474574.1 D-alanyl-D-alanine carboxypeptidase/D-alanyl-D-alanine-endopeptidase [Actinophytocola sp.]